MAKICPDCGAENADIAQFCKGCGKNLETEKETEIETTKADKDLNYNLIGYGIFGVTLLLFFAAYILYNMGVSLIYFFVCIGFLVYVIYTARRNLISNTHMFILLILSLLALFLSFCALFL